jgi:hypothetical protein
LAEQSGIAERREQLVVELDSEELVSLKNATFGLLRYCQRSNWAGYDPYDALNSRIFEALPFLHFKLARLVLTQGLKRSPINFRPLLLIPKTKNPKGLALFLTAILKLSKTGLLEAGEVIKNLIAEFVALRSPHTAYWCWGYSFPWQTRTSLIPRGAPNLVCTSFVASALLDLYETSGEERFLVMAASSADYIRKELLWTDRESVASFSYPAPCVESKIHNANFLGAALLCRVYSHTAQQDLMEVALAVARYSAGRQCEDGSWDYGEAPTQKWKDNFHTGFNLCALRCIGRYASTSDFKSHLSRGLNFYVKHFFTHDGAPRYFHNRTEPLDVHSAAQSIITLLECKELAPGNMGLARVVLNWTLANLLDKAGYFYYQKREWGTRKTPFMRWGQAWMLLALAAYLEAIHGGITTPAAVDPVALSEVVQ